MFHSSVREFEITDSRIQRTRKRRVSASSCRLVAIELIREMGNCESPAIASALAAPPTGVKSDVLTTKPKSSMSVNALLGPVPPGPVMLDCHVPKSSERPQFIALKSDVQRRMTRAATISGVDQGP